MPGTLPFSQPPFVTQYITSTEFLRQCGSVLRDHEHSCIVMFAHALKRKKFEAMSSGVKAATEQKGTTVAPTKPLPCESFWLVVWSPALHDASPHLDLILMCDSWRLGNYPIFIWTGRSESEVNRGWLGPRIDLLTQYLYQCVPRERVFAVFGKTELSKSFAAYWSRIASMPTAVDPLYDAILTCCTRTTFKPGQEPPAGHMVRLAKSSDLPVVAQLCKRFSDASVCYSLSREDAKVEARELIEGRQAWVYQARSDVAAICAAARDGQRVTVISKVFTLAEARNRGFAEHLVRHVTRLLLIERKRDAVILYVGRKNRAQSIYSRVGYVGLCGMAKPVMVEEWQELGFDGATMGHW